MSEPPFHRVVVALDGSPESLAALRTALALVGTDVRRFDLVHVVPSLEEYWNYAPSAAPLVKELAAAGRAILDDARGRLATGEVEATLATGDPALEIIRDARAAGADLVVLGRRGSSGRDTGLLGSVSQKVALLAKSSVLVVRDDVPVHRILLPIDGSDESRRAVEIAAALARRLAATVSVCFVVSATSGDSAFTVAPAATDPFLRDAEAVLRSQGVPAVREIKYGHPVREIRKLADRHELIAMGSKGRSSVDFAAMGSVSLQVLQAAPCSVLIVRR